MMALLFDKTSLPRSPKVKRMHVVDAGNSGCREYPLWYRFECMHCKYHEEGAYADITMTEAKRGLPCPKCNDSNGDKTS